MLDLSRYYKEKGSWVVVVEDSVFGQRKGTKRVTLMAQQCKGYSLFEEDLETIKHI